MSGTLPNFVVIGAQKSGTTSLHYHLRGHPDVFVAPGKELHYFDQHLDEGLDWYRAKFVGATTESAVGEATPEYMYFNRAVKGMAEAIPQARLIAILRNPVDRAYSHYLHERVRGREKLKFADALRAEPERLAEGDSSSAVWHSYIDRGRYLQQLQRVCEMYPKESLKVLLFEEFCEDTLGSLRSVFNFLDVDDNYIPPTLGVAYNRRVPARSLKLRAITRRFPLVHRIIDPLNTPSESYPKMEPQVRENLQGVFSDDNAALASWLGRDLSIWER